jgi:imidazole glycerol-phosphate synthase subunit HisF
MLTRRIIPCLDVLDGRVVKGRRFRNLVDVGEPVDLAARYSAEGADEIVLLDISATIDGRRPFFDIVTKVAKSVAIPLTIGGGIKSLEDILELLHCGADKVTLNTVLTQDPDLLGKAADRFGSQALVAAIDVQRSNSSWSVHVKSGLQDAERDALDWARTVVRRGAGEILITSIDMDGMKSGYDLELLRRMSEEVRVPVVASGGAGSRQHILEALKLGKADAVLAASIFHFNEISIHALKTFLRNEGIPVRL